MLNLFQEKASEIMLAATNIALPSNNRSVWITKENKSFFLDAYNANPSSMSASIDSFLEHLKNKSISLDNSLFILGDMNELGDIVEEKHKELATFLKEQGAPNAIFVGRYSELYKAGFGERAICFNKVEELVDNWEEFVNKFDYFFIKGSRSVQLERLLA